ncbi:hypothetical protein [Lysinibacillus sp. NPDC092081]|uniref:hypothetical protein n=1 Tax=Lysinibacillus sp. NPDC092081 TaxID=3364131 RepID=UPI0038111AAE
MLELQNEIKIYSINSKHSLILKTRYLVEINYTFALFGQSKYNSLTSHFCIRKEQIKNFCTDLGNEYACVELADNDSDGYIEIIKNKEEVVVKAQIGGTHEEYLYIEFESNTRTLKSFINDLNELLRYEDV